MSRDACLLRKPGTCRSTPREADERLDVTHSLRNSLVGFTPEARYDNCLVWEGHFGRFCVTYADNSVGIAHKLKKARL
jgi:hypothetical protein